MIKQKKLPKGFVSVCFPIKMRLEGGVGGNYLTFYNSTTIYAIKKRFSAFNYADMSL